MIAIFTQNNFICLVFPFFVSAALWRQMLHCEAPAEFQDFRAPIAEKLEDFLGKKVKGS